MSYLSITETLADDQAVTAAAVSENIYRQALNDSGNATLPFGDHCEKLYVVVTCTAAMTDASSNSTLAVTLESDTDASSGGDTLGNSPTVHATVGTFPATSAAGTQLIAEFPNREQYGEYIGLRFTPANGDLSGGTFHAVITNQIILDNNGTHFADGRNFV